MKFQFLILLVCCGCPLAMTTTVADDPSKQAIDRATERGRDFLASLFNPELNLLPEYHGATIFWLYHDNYLATKVLAESHPALAHKIANAIEAFGESESGKIEILFGESAMPLPFRQYKLLELKHVGENLIRTERVTEHEMQGWEAYADLRFLAAIALSESDSAKAKEQFDAGMQMFDGIGFDDPAKQKLSIYATYKVALALIAADRLKQSDSVQSALIKRLRSLQNESGGWITDYRPDGTPVGKANVETSCLAILALQTLASE